jgi:hypothetical protein
MFIHCLPAYLCHLMMLMKCLLLPPNCQRPVLPILFQVTLQLPMPLSKRLIEDPRYSRPAHLALKKVCEDLPEELVALVTDEAVLRFIVASDGHVPAAYKKLRRSVEWLHENMRPSDLTCALCLSDSSSHSHIPIGIETTDEQSTIIYGCPARASHHENKTTVEHVGRQLEYCFSLPITGMRALLHSDFLVPDLITPFDRSEMGVVCGLHWIRFSARDAGALTLFFPFCVQIN